MVSFWLMSPKELCDYERLQALEIMDLFGIPIEVKHSLEIDSDYFESIDDGDTGILCYEPGKIYIPFGNKLLLRNSGANKFHKDIVIAEVESAVGGPLEELIFTASVREKRLVLEEGFSVYGPKLFPENKGSCIYLSGININPSDEEISQVIIAMNEYGVKADQKD